MKRRNRQNSYERGGQVELAKAMGNVAKKGDKEINQGREEIKRLRKDITKTENEVNNLKRGIDIQNKLKTKKEGYIKDIKKDLGGIYKTVQDANKQKAKFADGGKVDYNEIKNEVLSERGYEEKDFHKGNMSKEEARDIMREANKRYSELAKSNPPLKEDLGMKSYAEGGKVRKPRFISGDKIPIVDQFSLGDFIKIEGILKRPNGENIITNDEYTYKVKRLRPVNDMGGVKIVNEAPNRMSEGQLNDLKYKAEVNPAIKKRYEFLKEFAKGGKTTQRKYYTYDIVGDKVHIYQQNKEDENSFDSIEQIIIQLKKEGHKEKDFVVLKKDGKFAKGGKVKVQHYGNTLHDFDVINKNEAEDRINKLLNRYNKKRNTTSNYAIYYEDENGKITSWQKFAKGGEVISIGYTLTLKPDSKIINEPYIGFYDDPTLNMSEPFERNWSINQEQYDKLKSKKPITIEGGNVSWSWKFKVTRDMVEKIEKRTMNTEEIKFAKGGEVGKTYQIKGADVTFYEDSYEEGEQEQFHSYYLGENDFPYKTEFSSKKDLFDTLNDFVSYADMKEEDFYVDEDTIQTSALVKYKKDSDWDEFSAPTEKEIELWKEGKMKLYSAQFVFPYEVYKKEKLEFAKGGKIVWVGDMPLDIDGREELTKEEAERLAKEWKEKGYDDVIIEDYAKGGRLRGNYIANNSIYGSFNVINNYNGDKGTYRLEGFKTADGENFFQLIYRDESDKKDTILSQFYNENEAIKYFNKYKKRLEGHYKISDNDNKADYAKGGEVKKKENNEMLIGGLAGILLGIFLNK